MKKLMVAAAVAVLLGASAFADMFYVDANYGNDDWDGTTPEIPSQEIIDAGGTIPGPRKTLVAVMSIEGLGDGDEVVAAPGLYAEGLMGTTQGYRVVVPVGVTLRASGSAAETVICGEKSATGTDGHGDDSKRAVYLNDRSILCGFTVSNGYTTASGQNNGGGLYGAGVAKSLAVGCRFVNNRANYRGDHAYGATLLRCYIGTSTGAYGLYNSIKLMDSVYDCSNSFYTSSHSEKTCCNNIFLRGCMKQMDAVSCIVMGAFSSRGNDTIFRNCLLTMGLPADCTDGGGNTFSATAAQYVYESGTFRPKLGSLAIDNGDGDFYAEMTNGWSETWQSYVRDYTGGIRTRGPIDIGPGEYDWTVENDTIGLTRTVTEEEDGVKIELERNFKSDLLVTSVRVNGEVLPISEYATGVFWTGHYGSVDDVSIVPLYAAAGHWYVNPNVDPTKGIVGDDGNKGYSPLCPKLTLAGAMAVATASGSVVHAAPGVYNKGGMNHWQCGSNRVVVAAGVVLKSDEGPDVTFIEGKISAAEDNVNGCASDSMRAVYLNSGAVLSGFTVTKGRPTGSLTGNPGNGGGVYGGLSVDCVFSNNVARNRGNAAQGATLLRCYIGADPAGSYSAYSGTDFIDCVHNSSLANYSAGVAYNTTFLKGYMQGVSGNQIRSYNSMFYSTSPTYCNMYNCRCVNAKGTGSEDMDELNLFSRPKDEFPREEGSCRPVKGSKAIDAGVARYYALATNGWSATWQSFAKGVDYAGGQRVYNGAVDVGCGEYDWRGDFAKTLAKKDVTVDVATANVTTNLEAGVDVPAGESLKLKLVLRTDGKVSFKVVVEDGAVLAVTVGGEPVAPGEGGQVEFEALAGEAEVEIAVTGEGKAAVSDVILPKLGALLLVR